MDWTEIASIKVLASRKAVDTYRTAHTELHSNPWHKGVPEAHTPLLNTMLASLKEQDFNSLQEFFDTSKQLEDGWS